jgi:hypothetical protein
MKRERLNIQEDVWDFHTASIKGVVTRFDDSSIERANLDGSITETYVSGGKASNNPALAAHWSGTLHQNIVWESRDISQTVTDLYLTSKYGLSVNELSTLGVNTKLAGMSAEIMSRFTPAGEFIGHYYCGLFTPLVEAFCGGSPVFDAIKNHYPSVLPEEVPLESIYCLVKDFRDKAIYVVYPPESPVVK